MTISVSKIQEQVSDRYDFLGEWMKVAEDRNLFFRFFCYFLSFNHLYSKDNCLHADENNDPHDMPKITRFLVRAFRQARDRGSQKYRFPNDFDFGKCTLQKHVRVLAEPELLWKDTEPYIETALANEGVVRGSEEWNLIKIFLRIYKIRCNLFHGDKSPADANDVARVSDSCVILESFLRWYVECGLYVPEKIVIARNSATPSRRRTARPLIAADSPREEDDEELE